MSENQNGTVYVVNLDRKRIFILSGALLMVCAGAFFLGSRFHGAEKRNELNLPGESAEILLGAERSAVANTSENASVMTSPGEQIRKTEATGTPAELPSADAIRDEKSVAVAAEKSPAEKSAALSSEERNLMRQDPFINSPPSKRRQKALTPAETGTKTAAHTGNPREEKTAEGKAGGSYFTVQVGAFAREKDAARLISRLSAGGIRARSEKGSKYFFVVAGRSADYSSLKPELARIREKSGLNAIIVRKSQ